MDVSSHSINTIKKILHRPTQVIIHFIKLIINTDQHTSYDKRGKTSLEFSEEKNKCILSECVHMCVYCLCVSVHERGGQREREIVCVVHMCLCVEECAYEA